MIVRLSLLLGRDRKGDIADGLWIYLVRMPTADIGDSFQHILVCVIAKSDGKDSKPIDLGLVWQASSEYVALP